jgi:hypothetical protein
MSGKPDIAGPSKEDRDRKEREKKKREKKPNYILDEWANQQQGGDEPWAATGNLEELAGRAGGKR